MGAIKGANLKGINPQISKLGRGLEVPALAVEKQQGVKAIRAAVDFGVTLFDTVAVPRPFADEEAVRPVPGW